MLTNRLVWRRLYKLAQDKYQLLYDCYYAGWNDNRRSSPFWDSDYYDTRDGNVANLNWYELVQIAASKQSGNNVDTHRQDCRVKEE